MNDSQNVSMSAPSTTFVATPGCEIEEERDFRQIGILGSGKLARALAAHLVKNRNEVLLSNSRGPWSLQTVVANLGKSARAVTVQEAAQAPVVVLAVPWPQAERVLKQFKNWDNRILIDATNHSISPSMELADLNGRISSEIVAELAPGARVVKALNTLCARNLADGALVGSARRVIFLSGDDAEATTIVSLIVAEIGFAPVNLGSLHHGGRLQQLGGPLAGPNFVVMTHRFDERRRGRLASLASLRSEMDRDNQTAGN